MDRYSTPEFEPYVSALGQFALAWNDLQNNLCRLFAIVIIDKVIHPGDEANNAPEYAWHAVKSDRAQREMLREAVTHSKLPRQYGVQSDGLWLITEVGKLEDRRNDILHSPLISIKMLEGHNKIFPNTFAKNPRAKKLREARDLLEEIKSALKNAILLADFADALTIVFLNPQQLPYTLPCRPSLQGRHPKEKLEGQTPTRHK
jgi:hypothetical protein